MTKTKTEWINCFRNKGNEIIAQLGTSGKNRNDKASEINKGIKLYREELLSNVKNDAISESWKEDTLLNEILLLTYGSYIAMLESRNAVWPYEYMAFARRIGELWEPFCKLPFEHPVKALDIIDPPDFGEVQQNIKDNFVAYVNSLEVDEEIKAELKNYYEIPWSLVDSGGIKLGLDLHFEQENIHYNCDFKSGFSSNEKGNTNRLLLVASIYHSLGENEKTYLFVRQNEDENNHYLQTLKNSPYWQVFCADECYAAIYRFTGFNIREWIDTHIDWQNDISSDFKAHLESNDLLRYLTW